MKKTKFIFLWIVLAFLVQGCVTSLNVNTTMITSQTFAPTDRDQVELFFSKLPNREYEEIASVMIYSRVDANSNRNFEDLRTAAAKMGANAVIQIRANPYINGIAVRWK